ncbi:unnamed protein product [Penicillium pancosmium]
MPVPCVSVKMQLGIGELLLQHETVCSGRHNVRMAAGNKKRGLDFCQTIEVASISGEFENRSKLRLSPGSESLPPCMAEGETRHGGIEEKIHHAILGWWLFSVCSSTFQYLPRRQDHTFTDYSSSAGQESFC